MIKSRLTRLSEVITIMETLYMLGEIGELQLDRVKNHCNMEIKKFIGENKNVN